MPLVRATVVTIMIIVSEALSVTDHNFHKRKLRCDEMNFLQSLKEKENNFTQKSVKKKDEFQCHLKITYPSHYAYENQAVKNFQDVDICP